MAEWGLFLAAWSSLFYWSIALQLQSNFDRESNCFRQKIKLSDTNARSRKLCGLEIWALKCLACQHLIWCFNCWGCFARLGFRLLATGGSVLSYMSATIRWSRWRSQKQLTRKVHSQTQQQIVALSLEERLTLSQI